MAKKSETEKDRQAVVTGVLVWPCLTKPAEMSGKHEVVVTQLSDSDAKTLAALGLETRTRPDKPDYGSYITPKSGRPPLVVDWNKNALPVERVESIGNGTKAKVAIRAFDYDYNGKKGTGAGLQAVQVLELKVYNPASAFEVEGSHAPDPVTDDVPF